MFREMKRFYIVLIIAIFSLAGCASDQAGAEKSFNQYMDAAFAKDFGYMYDNLDSASKEKLSNYYDQTREAMKKAGAENSPKMMSVVNQSDKEFYIMTSQRNKKINEQLKKVDYTIEEVVIEEDKATLTATIQKNKRTFKMTKENGKWLFSI